ncbi:hypothetical protein SAMN05442782_8229 [Streptomyces sp. OK228]|nr:hypothetical protein SAMN05442782_8229 [Streptomyces sp. OK228]
MRRLHHKRTRSSREQRGITVKAEQAGLVTNQPFTQVSARTSRK